MLILNRNKDESVIINGNIEIKIVDVRISGAKRVRLGITAPREISVHRKEVQDAINREKELSAAGLVS